MSRHHTYLYRKPQATYRGSISESARAVSICLYRNISIKVGGSAVLNFSSFTEFRAIEIRGQQVWRSLLLTNAGVHAGYGFLWNFWDQKNITPCSVAIFNFQQLPKQLRNCGVAKGIFSHEKTQKLTQNTQTQILSTSTRSDWNGGHQAVTLKKSLKIRSGLLYQVDCFVL